MTSDLYNQIKSAIHYARGIQGVFDVGFYNIETLVNTLYELERNEEHPIYPFIATWNSRLIALAGSGFHKVADFRDKIVGALQTWVQPEDYKADYYQGLKRLQGDLQFPLRVCRKKEFGDFREKLLAHNCLLTSFSTASNDFCILIFRDFRFFRQTLKGLLTKL